MKIVESSKIKEKAYIEKLENGMKVIIIPKQHTKKKYIIWGTHFGSIDNHFIMPQTGEEVYIPDGVAHFLEHKMFEQPDGTNSLDTLMALGLDANAYTTNDHTAYLFECTDHFEEGLNELMDYVQHPYFTDENVEKEKGIKKEAILESIETALVTAYKRNFDSEENVKVTMDGQTGEIHIYAVKDVVEEVENPNTQILLSDAKNIDSKLLVGDKAEIELMPKNFGRIAAQTAKQIIVQKIREESRNLVFDEFNERKGEIVSGIVQKADGNIVVLDLGKLEAVMPAKEQVPTEHYHVNDKIRAYIMNVEKGLKGAPQVTVSRACSDFVRKLFELEIPEIYEGVIEIKSVSRDAGNRSKVAVYSPNENIDPVGSCVGQKGIRIQNIINELHGEKIDVIEWNQDPAIYISAALLPAQVMAVDAHEDEKFAQVIVPDDQLSLAIGKAGQNARLAARLTGWKIDIKSETQFREMLSKQQEESDEETKTEE